MTGLWAGGASRLTSLPGRVLERLARVLPGALGAKVDRLRPALARGFGGPFNGQERRAEAVRDVFARIRFACVVETGTYRATTTLFLSQLTKVPIATIELNARYYHYARRQLVGTPNVTLMRGDSATVLETLPERPPWDGQPCFFYLDAHWSEHLPLREELDAICAGWRDFAVLIDDFRVPGDPGYAYDDYGPGQALELPILASISNRPVVIYWPSAPSIAETGARRGWILLASAGVVDDSLSSARTLRRSGPVSTVLVSPDASARTGA